MPTRPDPAQALAHTRLTNALALFEEFVRATARHADAATLRGLERRFAERVQIQPSYWSQIKSRSRQIGERLARQFEELCHKPRGWMDIDHGSTGVDPAPAHDLTSGVADDAAPRDDDERFIIGLVLTYYRRHPQRARTRLLDLLGEVLVPLPAPQAVPAAPAMAPPPATAGAMVEVAPGVLRPTKRPPAGAMGGPGAPLSPQAEDAHALWLQSQSGVAPLKRKK